MKYKRLDFVGAVNDSLLSFEVSLKMATVTTKTQTKLNQTFKLLYHAVSQC
jgi:hypothetical protein